MSGGRTYRFGPLERAGVVLGLDAQQCLALGAAVLVVGAALEGGHGPAALAALPAAAAYAFGSVGGQPMRDLAPSAARHLLAAAAGRRRWLAPLPLLSADPASPDPALPPFLDGLALVDAGPAPWAAGRGRLGVVVDRPRRTATAALRVRGREFALAERADQERLIELWGDALGAFCAEHSPVASVRVIAWAGPAGLDAHRRRLEAAAVSPAVAGYDRLLEAAGRTVQAREVTVAVTVDARRLGRRRGGPPEAAAVAEAGEQLRLLAGRLEAAGLDVAGALSAPELAEALRVRLDPTVASRLEARRRSLAALAGVVSPYDAGPLAVEERWGHLRVDGSVHRTYWVAEWPRAEVGPGWLTPLLASGGGPRAFCLHLEPTPPSRARRRVDRDATRLAADEATRARAGFRVGARHRRAEAAVAEREAELVAGYAELAFCGFVTVSAPGPEALEAACAEEEQAAAQAGVELRALWGRQARALLCTLPVGRGLAGEWWS